MNTDLYYSSHPNRHRLVHIADPNLGICEALSVLFRLEGFQTSFSNDGAQFATMLDRRRPDVAIINLRLREESGIHLLRRLKEIWSSVCAVMRGTATPCSRASRARMR